VAPPDFSSRLVQRTRSVLENHLTAVSGVEEVLNSLSVPYCVASNGNRANMTFTLEHTGLLHRFQGRMYCAEDVAAPKPAPDLFLHAARESKVTPERCVVVEDTPTGVVAARAAGMRAYGFAGLTPPALHRQHQASCGQPTASMIHRAATSYRQYVPPDPRC
jgi:HAD superfamily hydrolase (TIGR01509 family)